MTIETECPECGKAYRIRDEMAGKRFRCKACQAAVTIPGLDEVNVIDEGDDEFLGGLDRAVQSEQKSASRLPPPAVGPNKSGTSAGRKKKASADGVGLSWLLKILGGVLAAGIGFVLAYFLVGQLMSGDGAQVPQAWASFTPPGGGYQIEMPGTPERDPRNPNGYVIDRGSFACGVEAKSLSPQQAAMTTDQLLEEAAPANRNTPRPGVKYAQPQSLSFGAFPAREHVVTVNTDGRTLTNTLRILVTPAKVYKLAYLQEGALDTAARDRFFNSFQLLDESGQPQPDTWGVAGGEPATTYFFRTPNDRGDPLLAGTVPRHSGAIED